MTNRIWFFVVVVEILFYQRKLDFQHSFKEFKVLYQAWGVWKKVHSASAANWPNECVLNVFCPVFIDIVITRVTI